MTDYVSYVQDGLGWTPLMIAASVKDGEDMVTWLTGRGADVGEKSEFISCSESFIPLIVV